MKFAGTDIELQLWRGVRWIPVGRSKASNWKLVADGAESTSKRDDWRDAHDTSTYGSDWSALGAHVNSEDRAFTILMASLINSEQLIARIVSNGAVKWSGNIIVKSMERAGDQSTAEQWLVVMAPGDIAVSPAMRGAVVFSSPTVNGALETFQGMSGAVTLGELEVAGSMNAGVPLWVMVAETCEPGTSGIRRSIDGMAWSEVPDPGEGLVEYVETTYGGGVHVAIAKWGTSIYSPNGYEWFASDLPSEQYKDVVWGTEFKAVTTNKIATSADGATWTVASASGYVMERLAYGNGVYVATYVQYSYPYNYGIRYSLNGSTWTNVNIGLAVGERWYGVCYGNGLFVALALSGVYTAQSLMTSPDGINWTWRNLINRGWHDVAYGNGLFVAVGTSKNAYSSDGINWTLVDVPACGYFSKIGYRNGLFVAVRDGYIAYTSNGADWTSVAIPNTWAGINSE